MNLLFSDNFSIERVLKCFSSVIDLVKTHQKVCSYGAGAVVFVVISHAVGRDLKKRLVVWVNNNAENFKDQRIYSGFRSRLVEPLKTLTSQDAELRKENAIRILEIGVGVGKNFENYPEGSHLVLVDPNPHFHQLFTEKVKTSLNSFKLKPDDIIIAKGEEMDMVKSESIDAVVVSLVLCSVTDIAKVLAQVKRVLVPGGKFLFMEHVREFEPQKHRVRRFFQTFLSVTRFWPSVLGCYLNRDPLPNIKEAGFSEVKGEYVHATILYTFFKVLSPHLIGEATK